MPAAGGRAYIEIPEVHGAIHASASATAKRRGDILAEFVHDAILTATAAAEAGHGHLLPPKPTPERRKRGPEETVKGGTPIRYKAAEGERDRCWAAIYAAGSSPAAVAVAALAAYESAHGVRMDVMLPWVPRLRRRAVRDQPADDGPLARAGAA